MKQHNKEKKMSLRDERVSIMEEDKVQRELTYKRKHNRKHGSRDFWNDGFGKPIEKKRRQNNPHYQFAEED